MPATTSETSSVAHQLDALLVDLLALAVHDVVEAQQVLADLEVARLDLALRRLERLVEPAMGQRLVVGHALLLDPVEHLVVAEDAHQVVFQRQEELRRAGIALAARAAAQLVVDAAALVALGADHVEAARLAHDLAVALDAGADLGLDPRELGLALGLVGELGGDLGLALAHQHLDVAAELDVGAAAGHVGGDGDGARPAGLGHDLRLLLVEAGVQHVVRDAGLLQLLRQRLGLLDRHRADQHRLVAGAALLDQLDDGARLVGERAVDLVVGVLAGDRHVGRDLDHLEPVDLAELGRLGHRRAGHAGQLGIHAEQVLEGDRGQRLVLALDLDLLLGLERLVQALGIAAAGHHAAGELVDDDDLAVLDDVVDVAREQLVGAQRLRHVMQHRDLGRRVEADALGSRPSLRRISSTASTPASVQHDRAVLLVLLVGGRRLRRGITVSARR